MRIQEMIDQLEKLKDEYPEHDVEIRNTGWIVERIEICNQGVEIVPTKKPKAG